MNSQLTCCCFVVVCFATQGRPSGPDAQYIVDLLLFSRMDDEGLPKPVPSDELASADMEVRVGGDPGLCDHCFLNVLCSMSRLCSC